MSEFTREYYENGKRLGLSCYENYRWLPELTIPMAEALVAQLGIEEKDFILDYGCAKGYLVKALRGMGYNAWGLDISEYAISQADPETKPYLYLGPNFTGTFAWIICKDVLEHIEEKELHETLVRLRYNCLNLFVVVPLGHGNAYTIPEMEKDVTHRIRQPLWWWGAELEKAGFKSIRSAFSMPGIKEAWTRKFPFGNGFLVCR